MKYLILFVVLIIVLISCTKKVAKDPNLAYSDFALLDSINMGSFTYYKNDPATFLPGTIGPHGPYKLRFNKTGFNALTDNGKLPVGKSMPNGSFIVKDIYDGNNEITLYAFMYKYSGSWLWGEIKPNKEVLYSVYRNPSTCINCHSQTGNRDLVTTFNFH
ncbi:MAG: hypothetical protein H0W73_10135 [Bacteroidetes bacterium]|nr:hypothetical protein [Bacteroidota bacterium]